MDPGQKIRSDTEQTKACLSKNLFNILLEKLNFPTYLKPPKDLIKKKINLDTIPRLTLPV